MYAQTANRRKKLKQIFLHICASCIARRELFLFQNSGAVIRAEDISFLAKDIFQIIALIKVNYLYSITFELLP